MLSVIGICVSALASLGFIAHLLRKAPEGWEDSQGFHYRGAEPLETPTAAVVRRPSIFHGDAIHAASLASR